MALPERPQLPSPTLPELVTKLDAINTQFEIADENENQIERLFERDKLLEQRDWLQAQIDELS